MIRGDNDSCVMPPTCERDVQADDAQRVDDQALADKGRKPSSVTVTRYSPGGSGVNV